jgi:glycosyltransferase involved in cell wall biosynthesis
MAIPLKPYPPVSVIIPVYNNLERLKICLQALEKQTYPDNLFEILVVDNASDQSIEAAISHFKSVRTLWEPIKGSYTARNKGIELSNGDVIAFTDSDCIPEPDWIEKGVYRLFSEENCGMVGGKIEIFALDREKPTIYEHHDRITYLQQELWINQFNYGATANLFTLRSIIEEVGVFKTELKSLGDVEWCRRMFVHGYKPIYGDDVCVWHPARRSFIQLYRKTVRVAGGVYDLGLLTNRSFSRFAYDMVRGLLPSLTNTKLILFDKQLKGVRQKTLLLFIDLFLRYCRQLEILRLIMGGSSRNY